MRTRKFENLLEWIANVPSDRGSIPLWAGIIGAPLLWATHLQLQYMLTWWCCTTGQMWVLHALTLLFLAAAGYCCYLCWREWHNVGAGALSSDEAPPVGRSRFAGLLGLMSGSLFALLIVAQHLPTFFLSPCWD
jgi:hypothetical protein